MSGLKPERRIRAAASKDDTPLGPAGQPNPASASGSNKRRSSRVAIDIPVEVFGQSLDGKIFHEETRTLVVNAHGALISLATGINLRQTILLVNKKTNNQMECRVTFRKEIDKERAEVAIEFANPSPRFWGIAFPPEDWNRAERKQPSRLPTEHSSSPMKTGL